VKYAIDRQRHVFGKYPITSKPKKGTLIAKTVLAALAGPAFSAPGGGIGRHAVTGLEPINPRPHLLN
jgi:hypothetical protein